MKFDISSARSAGYSDDEIADYLASQNNFDLGGALKSGYSASEVIGFLSGGSAPAEPVTDTGDETARLAARYKAPGLIERASSSLPRPVDPLGIASGKPLGATPARAQQPSKAPAAPTPYRDRREALDDAVNLLEEGADQGKVADSFGKAGITFDEITAHGKKRGSDYFKQQAAPAVDPEVQRLLKRAPAPVTGEIKGFEPTVTEELGNLVTRGIETGGRTIDVLRNQAGLGMSDDLLATRIAQRQRRIEAARPGTSLQDDMQAIADAGDKGLLEAAGAISRNPTATLAMIAESVIATAPAAAASAGGFLINPVAGTAAAFGSGAAMEYGATIVSTMIDAGMNPSDPASVARALADPDLMAKAQDRGMKRGLTVGAFSALTAGVASRFAKPILQAVDKSQVGRAAGLSVGAAGTGIVGDSLGEAAAQAAVGDPFNYSDILIEGLAGGPGSLADVGGASVAAMRNDPARQLARELDAGVAGANFTGADPVARSLLDVNSYDPALVDPSQTTRGGMVGPSAPINFTPTDSPSAQAGLAPIVVPVPAQQETTDVSATSVPPLAAAGSGQLPSDQFGGGLDLPGSAVNDAAEQRGGSAGQPGANVQQAGAVPGAAGKPAAGLNRPFDRATDQDLMARTEASIASQENNNADTPRLVEPWLGRRGNGYVTQADAAQAIGGRQRKFPTLDWKVEQMPNGKFMLAGYSTTQETNLGTQTPQAIQGQAQQQQAPAIAGAASPGVGQPLATGGATQATVGGNAGAGSMAAGAVAGPRPAGALATPEGAATAGLTAPLRLAPPAPLRAVGQAIKALSASTGVDAEVDTSPLTEQQQAASAIARLSGRTVTILKADTPGSLPNGFMLPGDNKNIYIANDSDDAPLSIAMHEIYHSLPEQQRKALNTQLLQLFRQDRRGEFAAEFSYDKNNDTLLDEEIPAFMVQAVSKRADFWQELRTKMGNKEFAEVAKVILEKLNQILTGARKEYGDDFVSKYITDVAKARDLLTTAYAEAMQEQGLTPDADVVGDVMMARRAKTEKVGEFDVATAKDGSLTVFGDSDAIRAQIPDNVQGRVTKEGITFTNAAAPRVRAALEGRQVAYSRGGQVTEKLPMKNGKYLGAPAKFDTPGKIPTLRKILRQLADEGAPGRYWYENSGKAVLKMVGGDVNEARKFVALLAIYSPQAKVDANSTFALRAWAQYKAGQPISVKTKVMDDKAKAALDDVDAFWSGEKTGNFFFNLLREIDPTTAGKQGATIDMWMMRAGQYDTDAPTGTQYSFMENETNRLAQELGWEPQQVQAAIWVAMKARMENSGVKKMTEKTSEKKGWIKFVPGKDGKGKVRVILDAQKHRDNWLKYSFEHDVTKDDTQQAKFDFGDGLQRHIGQVSFEVRPGRTSGVLPGIHSAPYAQQVEFQQAVQKAFFNANGTDELAAYLGLLVDSDILAPGVWQGEISPSTQLGVAMAPAKGEEGKTNVDAAQAKALNIYAAVAGLVARQEGVGWHRPFYASTKRDANGLDINVGRVLNPREVADLETAVGQWMADNGKQGWQDQFAFVSSPSGIRVVNFGIITNDILQTAIVEVAESVLPDFDYRVFASSGDMPTNNWKENPNGESYVQRIGAEGRSDVLDWARATLAPRVQRVFDEYSERYGWGDAGELKFSKRAGDGSGRQGSGSAQDRQVQASERADAQTVQGLSATDALPGAPTVRGFTGPDPRLVAVAEQYARDNGITLRRQAEYAQVDPERAARIAAAYEAMPHAPQDLRVKAAYKELIAQTLAQYRALEKAGYKFWFINLDKPDNAEYASSPWNAMRDIRANKVMGVFPTDDGFGSGDFDPANNPLLEDTGIKWPSGSLFGPRKRVLANDLFRAVHDAFGHGLEGAGFRAQGEENAWQAHVRLFTGSAVAAITSETRGQNSWLNYGPNGESNRTAKVEDTVFADQKTGLLPEFAWTEGVVGDMPMFSNRAKPTFYSQLERAIANVPAKLATQPASQWALWLDSNGPKQGVKKDEVEWSGIKDYLALRGKDKVTSAELQAYLADSGVKVTETTYRGEVDEDELLEKYAVEMFDVEYFEMSADERRQVQARIDKDLEQTTRYEKYTLPGGENYRELLITLPEAKELPPDEQMQRRVEVLRELEADYRAEGMNELADKTRDRISKVEDGIQKAKLQKQKGTYKSSHWSEKNVVAHIRINDRTDADGKRVLFVEEVQSDWGQDGLKKGFGKVTRFEYEAVQDNGQLVRSFRDKGEAEAFAKDRGLQLKEVPFTVDTGIPAAPFVTKTEGWLNLALKRIAMLAVEEGYDKVAFVNGQQSADRYDLSKQISSISYEPGSAAENEGLLQAWDLDRKMVMSEMVTPDRVEDYVGKEVAVRLLQADKVRGKHLLDGENVKVGGKGMIKFYDEIVPQALSKLLPKIGGEKPGSVGVPLPVGNGEKTPAGAVQWVINVNGREYNGYSDEGVARQELAELLEDGKNAELIDARNPEVSQQPGFDVTDKMRETVGQGLPMFSKRAVVSTDESAGDQHIQFSKRTKPDPEKTVTAYKLFRVDARKPGQLFPLFVNANDPVTVGEWLDADIGPAAAGGKVKSKLGPLAFRPGWHAGDLPIATHIGGKSSADKKAPDIRPDNHVWAEVEMAADRDWQTVANERGVNKDGKLIAVKAHITDQLPVDGYYRYKTNPNMTGNWLIGGSMKVTRIMSDDEVKTVNEAAGAADLPRAEPFDAAKYGFGDMMRSNPDIRRSNRRQKLVGTNFTMDSSSKTDAARIKLQDDGLRMKRVIEAVKAGGGTVGEAQNFYDANTLMPGRIQAAIDDFKNNVVRPMLNKAAEFGIDMDELSMYAYAKHAKERNAYIASINPRMPDGGSGMTNDEADNILQMVGLAGDTAKFEELHQALMGIASATRQVMLSEGLITQDEFVALEGAYDNYIPLRGFENVDADTGVARPGIGRGVNIRGAETVKAMGRKSKAGDLIENVIRDYERVISRVEKNDVAKVLLDFVLSNPDPDLWGVDVERSKPGLNKATGLVQYTKAIEKGEDTIGVKVGGQQVYIKLADKELTRALRQAWKDETSGLERATLAMTGWWNDWMRAVLTKYNPAFALINIPRDALWSGTASALAELGPKGLARYLAVYPKALMASTRQEAGVSGTSNKLFGNPQMDARFAEFRSAGGITGGFYMRSLDDINQDLRNELLLAGAAARNPWEAIKSLPPFKLAKLTLRTLEFMGAASENATRFALYQASREVGNSPAKAAILAKDGTTNFNRKGEWGGALNNLYLFFNAAVQGNAQLFKVLKSPAVQASMAGVAGVGMMLALYGASAGGEDDDGEAYWDKIPSYVKERNIVIMLPPGDALAGGIERVGKRGRYVTIPVQYGFNIFPNVGYVMADVLRNAQDPKRGMTPTKGALHLTSTVLGSINPFGGAVDVSDGVQVLLAAMPTLVDLPIQLVTERGTFGTASSPFKSPWDVRPDSERMFTSQQDSVSAKIAKALNELGGGNEGKAGSILGMDTSVAPGTIQTLISATTGGLGTFVEQMGTSVIAMTGDDKDLKANKIPFLNKFYGEVDEGANTQTARERMDKIKKLADEVKAQVKLGLDPKLTKEEDRLMQLATAQETYQETMSQMRKYELEVIKDPKLTDAEKRLKRRTVTIDRDNLASDMNKQYLKAVPK